MTRREEAATAGAEAEDGDSDNSVQILDQPSTSNGMDPPQLSRKRPLGSKNCKDHSKNLVFTTTLQDHVR